MSVFQQTASATSGNSVVLTLPLQAGFTPVIEWLDFSTSGGVTNTVSLHCFVSFGKGDTANTINFYTPASATAGGGRTINFTTGGLKVWRDAATACTITARILTSTNTAITIASSVVTVTVGYRMEPV